MLDITVTNYAKHTKDARAKSEQQFIKEAKIKAYQVLATPFELFDPARKMPETRIDKKTEYIYRKNLDKEWTDINNLSEEDIKIFELNRYESESDKNRRIDFKILKKMDSFYRINKNENIVTFTAKIINQFSECKNMTEIAEKLYSLGFVTGSKQGEKMKLSPVVTKCLTSIGIDVKKLLNYINYQINLTDDELNELRKKEINKENTDYVNLIIKLRNARSTKQNTALTEYSNEQKKFFDTKDGSYSNKEVIIFANREVMRNHFSAENVVNNGISTSINMITSSIVYADKELEQIKFRKGYYVLDKGGQYTKNYIQSYVTGIATRHSITTLSLLDYFKEVTDETLMKWIIPNVAAGVSLTISSIFLICEGQFGNKSFAESLYDIVDNSIKVNATAIHSYLATQYIFWSGLISKISIFISSLGFTSGVTGMLVPGIVLAGITRIIKGLLFNKKQIVNLKSNESDIERYEKEQMLSYKNYIETFESLSDSFHKEILFNEMVKKGIVSYKMLNKTPTMNHWNKGPPSISYGCDI